MQNFVSIMGENAFAIIIAVMGFFGCFSFGLAGKGMSVLYNETLVMTSSNHPFIKQIKLRRENGMRINTSIHNTYIFVLKNMERYKYLNLSIDEYVKTAWLIRLICVMLGLISGIIKENMWYTAYGCVCAIAVSCVGSIEDVEQKKQRVVVNIVDYFDNVLTADRVSGEAARCGMDDDDRAEKIMEDEVSPSDSYAYKADGKEQPYMNDYGEKPTVISDEQRKLIEDVLREYLA